MTEINVTPATIKAVPRMNTPVKESKREMGKEVSHN